MANRIYSVANEFETLEEKNTKVILISKIHKTSNLNKGFALISKADKPGDACSVRKQHRLWCCPKMTFAPLCTISIRQSTIKNCLTYD